MSNSGIPRRYAGLIGGELKVEILSEGVHSGDASGGGYRPALGCLRRILDRIESPETGLVLSNKFNAPIPEKAD